MRVLVRSPLALTEMDREPAEPKITQNRGSERLAVGWL